MFGFSAQKNDTGGKPEAGVARRHTREPLDAAASAAAYGREKIGFVGLAAGAGATTLAFAAAEYLAALPAKRERGMAGKTKAAVRVCLLELDPRAGAPAGSPYDKIGIDRRFAGRDFVSFYKLAAEGKPLSGALNLDGGVNWALRAPSEPCPDPISSVLHRLANNVPADVCVCDISAQGFLSATGDNQTGRAILTAILADLDRIVCIIDPLPSRLLAGAGAAETMRAAEAAGVPAVYVFNKLNPGVNLREATRFTGVRDYIAFPAVRAEAVYAAEYACRSIAGEPEIKTALAALFGK
ncbi:MAG: hypothetical protein LBS91_00800 [Clostridiales Family XIII bacterium]|jgi:hypothetical protein|nr:hypothetical protein [Clostridiales Family XIII bacterium]